MSVVEIAAFRLAAGISDDVFLSLDRRVQTELVPNRRGFLRRTTARRESRWVVVTLWASESDAAEYDRATAADPLRLEFERALEPGSLVLTRFDTLD